ncbi:ABC transporter ATP-binding protein [Beggiatoa sp. PS]|nr:ABC transporter ATP-binding protein [Beggiatoa sp. PS]
MNLLEFIDNESGTSKSQIISMALLSGFANGLLLAIINFASDLVSNHELQLGYFFIYLMAFGLYVYTQKYAFSQATMTVESIIHKMRLRITDKLRRTELRFIENSKRGEIYIRLTQDSNLISQSALTLLSAGQSAMVLFFALLYLSWLSPMSFLITALFLGMAIFFYLSHHQHLAQQLHTATQNEAAFFETLNHILEGFKEIKVNREQSDALFNQLETLSQKNKNLKVNVGNQQVADLMFARTSFYFLLAILIFIIPFFHVTHADDIYKIAATILFILGPMTFIVTTLPILSRTRVALENLYALEVELEANLLKTNKKSALLSAPVPISEFQMIRFEEVIFHYQNNNQQSLFSLGPINLTLNKGEILFITGDNSSGKSTFLKLLVGLYYPSTGDLYWNNEIIEPANYPSYRELFSMMFSDFVMFDKLLGLSTIDEQTLNQQLRLLELEQNTQYQDGVLTHFHLSHGQKKRLAFLATVMENKPIYIFDELAIDHDPHLRKYFYEVVLKEFKKQGKTIIAVVHDDKYFDMADRVLKMENGKLGASPRG